MKERIRIIHLEDDPQDRELVRSLLQDAGIRCEIHCVDSAEAFQSALETKECDLIMSDFTLPGYDGMAALNLANRKRPDVPYIFVSGTMGEDLAVESLKNGATDYVLKHHLERLAPAVKRALQEYEDWEQRAQAERLRSAFLKLGQTLSTATSAESAARTILATAQELLDWDACCFDAYLAEHEMLRAVLRFEKVVGRCVEVRPHTSEQQLTPTIRACLDQNGLLITPEAGESLPPSSPVIEPPALRPSVLMVPVRHASQVIGIIAIEKFSLPAYTFNDLQTLLALADYCGGALARIAVEAEKHELSGRIARQQTRLDNILARIPGVVWESWRALGKEEHAPDFVSHHVEKMLGYRVEDWLAEPGFWLKIIHPEDRQRVLNQVENLFARGGGFTQQYRWLARDNRVVWVETCAGPIIEDGGRAVGLRGVAIEITDKKKIEAQLLRSQRIESIGKLASGLAHDLNNILAPIILSAQVLQEKELDEDGRNLVSVVETHGKRAADIIRQLLTFARGTEGERIPLNPRHLLDEMAKIARETFPKSIGVEVTSPADPWLVKGDPTQLHQVLLNLCVNARDAMPNGGQLTLKVANRDAREMKSELPPDLKAGAYVTLEVSDTGTGIPPGVLEKIFDPFFTTKGPNQGTGLGLSTALGIVKSHAGFMTVESEVGQGTHFRVCLPALLEGRIEPAVAEPTLSLSGRGESILIVDDETGIRELAKQVLGAGGYRTLTAANGAEALAILGQHAHRVDLVVTDLLMPVMDGVALARALRASHPSLRIVACTGLKSEDMLKGLREVEVTRILDKPYSADKLLSAVHQELNRPRTS